MGEVGLVRPLRTANGELVSGEVNLVADHVAKPSIGASWKVLVINDEEDVHRLTRLALSDISFDGRGIYLLHARSGAEAIAVFEHEPDIAVALVDVVMENEQVDLNIVRYVREELGNRFVRLILCTGHPWSAPEREVIVKFDVNDYKDKAELSSFKLYSSIMTALRSYRDIMEIEAQRLATARVLDVAAMLFQAHSVPEFALLALEGYRELLKIEGAAFYTDNLVGVVRDNAMLASVGPQMRVDELVSDSLMDRLDAVVDHAFDGGVVMVRLACRHANAHFVCARLGRELTALDRMLTKLFRLNATLALDNLLLLQKNQQAQGMAIRALATLAPYRIIGAPHTSAESKMALAQVKTLVGCRNDSDECTDFLRLLAVQAELGEWGGNGAVRHVEHVGRFASKLAELAGMNRDFCGAIELAGEMHDVGKIFVPPSGSSSWFEPDSKKRSRAVEHAITGAEFLRGISHYSNEIVRMMTEVALYHHEMWNGNGYPEGRAGEAIPIAARIVAIVDFFDKCISPKLDVGCRTMSPAEAFDLVCGAAGVYFDPKLAKIFLVHRGDFLKLI